MKKIFQKSLAFVGIMAVLLVSPLSIFAQSTPDIHFNDEVTVTELTGDYVVNVDLQVSGLLSLGGLSLIGVYDDNEIEAPFEVMNFTSQLLTAELSGGNYNMDFPVLLPNNPNGHYLQFFLVTTSTLNTIGINNFNPDNGSSYAVFTATPIWLIQYSGTTDPNQNTNPNLPPNFNPAVDCLNAQFANEPECASFLSNVPPFNPNFVLTSSLSNPLCDGPNADIDIIAFLQRLFRVMVKISLPFLVLFAVYSGLMFVEARGNTEKLESARKNFLYVIIGALIIFASWTIATVIKGTVVNISTMNDVLKEIIRLV